MSKRFTDSKKWSDDWWGPLDNDSRIIWLYLIDNCSIAGIWKKDMRGLNFNCNTNISEDELVKLSSGRLVDCGKFFFIPAFVKFQYPNGLGSNKPMILAVVKELSEHNLIDIIRERLGNDYLIIKVKEKENEKVEEEGNGNKEKGRAKKNKNEIESAIPDTWPKDKFLSLWAEYVEMRNKKKRPLTKNAVLRRLQQLVSVSGGSYDEAEKIALRSIDKAWDEFYAPDKTNGAELPKPEYGKTLIRDKA